MNLKELSKRLGLSQTTVSRALNGYPEVGEKTKERVLQMAAELNYRPNRFAKSLATGKTGHIGFIYPVERNLLITPLFNEFLGGITKLLVEKDMDLTIMPVLAEEELQAYKNLSRSGRVDGVVLSTPQLNDPRIELINDMGLPFIVHGRTHNTADNTPPTDLPFSYIDIDNKGAFEHATQLLIDMGHERIALVNDDPRFTFAYHRLIGYQAALNSQHISFDPRLVYTVEMTEEQGYQAALRALNRAQPPTAFIASSVILALGIKRAIRHIGEKPGERISVIAHDDELPYLQANKFDPPLTTVASSIAQAGYAVGHSLYSIIESGNRHCHQRLLDVDLIVRGSTGPGPNQT